MDRWLGLMVAGLALLVLLAISDPVKVGPLWYVGWAIGLAAVGTGALSGIRDLWRTINPGGRPRIVARAAYAKEVPRSWRTQQLVPEQFAIGSNTSTGAMTTTARFVQTDIDKPTFAYVDFANDSVIDAPKTAAHIWFYRRWPWQRNALLYMLGRWTEPEEANLTDIDFNANGIAHTLDVAFKLRDQDVAYAYNNDSRNASPAGWRMPGRELPPATYRVRVELRGVGWRQDYWFVLTNPGTGARLNFRKR